MICPECETPIQVGTVGISNFNKRHRDSQKCRDNQVKKKRKDATQDAARQFFAPRSATNPAPGPSAAQLLVKPPAVQPPTTTRAPGSQVGLQQLPVSSLVGASQLSEQSNIACPTALKLLNRFWIRIQQLPESIEVADDSCPLARFSGTFEGSVGPGQDPWEVWNGPLDTELQKSPEEVKNLVKRGEKGLKAVYNLLEYLALSHGVPGALLEGKVERLLHAIDDV